LHQLEKDILDEGILSVCGRILLINMKLKKFDCIKKQLDIIGVLCDGKLIYFGDFSMHINFEVGTMRARIMARIVKPSTSSLRPF
jgi:hypothetical protein